MYMYVCKCTSIIEMGSEISSTMGSAILDSMTLTRSSASSSVIELSSSPFTEFDTELSYERDVRTRKILIQREIIKKINKKS